MSDKVYDGIYDPADARCVVAGMIVSGYADGEKIKIEPVTKEDFKSHVGVDGTVSYTKVNDDRYTITVTLKQGSPSNVFFETLRKSRASFPVMISNPRGGKYIGGSTNCRFVEKPSRAFGAEDGKIEYKILAPDYSGSPLAE